MPRPALLLLLMLAACAEPDGQSAGPGDVQGWRFASGKTPTRAEYAAVVAACQDGAMKHGQAPLEACLADLGLKRIP